MDIQNFPKGKKLISEGEQVNRLYVVYRGTVQQTWGSIVLSLGPGTVVGLSDALNETYQSEYTCVEEVSAFPVYYEKVEDFNRIFDEMPVFIFGFAKGAFRQCRDILSLYDEKLALCDHFYNFTMEMYEEYKALCKEYGATARELPGYENLEEIYLENKIRTWEHNFIDTLNDVDNKEIESIYGKREEVVIGIIGISCEYMNRAAECYQIMGYYFEEFAPLLLERGQMDLFSLIYDLRTFVAQRRINPESVEDMMTRLYEFVTDYDVIYSDTKLIKEKWGMYRSHNFHEDTQIYEEAEELARSQYEDSLLHIAQFAGMSAEWIDSAHEIVDEYFSSEDLDGKDDATRTARKKATDMFYELYEATFFKSFKRYEITPIINAFLHFGFVSVDAVGPEIADEILDTTDKLFLCQSANVFTIYTWLKAIYKGEREPSKSELDLDYRGYLLEEKKNGNITDSQMSALSADKEAKVKYEIENFFKSANRATSGRMSAFCPILSAEGFGAELERMLVTTDKIKRALATVEDVDYGVFYRDQYFNDVKNSIRNEVTKVRLLPDVILMPNAGSRAMMWQECSGVKIDSPARFVAPIFTLDDISKMMLNCCGAFRWEICRKEQGSRWNDISSDCLTSDFYDYFTFYRKNKDLSPEQKEKVKTLIKNSRNNMREAFAKLYIIWINYEAKGSVRLLKPERELLFKHCTFSKKYRDAMADNPMFVEYISKFTIKNSQNIQHLKNVVDRIKKAEQSIPQELKDMEKYLNM